MIDSAEFNERISWKALKEIFPNIWWYGFNITAVYFLEMIVIGCYAERVSQYVRHNNPSNYFERNMFTLVTFAYTIGVAIARSSLYLVRINRIGILTTIQLLMNYCWFCEVAMMYIGEYVIIKNVYFLLLIVVFGGMMGGASYINVFNEIVNSKQIRITQKELAISICTLFYDMGVILSGLTGILLNHVLFPSKDISK